MSAVKQALDGLRVVEIGSYAAGPHIGKMLANFGACVVHVESVKRPDGFRLQYPPYKDKKTGINRGGCFAFFNDSKHGVTVDLKNAAGLELGRRMIGWADLVIENNRPGVIARLGLGFEAMRELNPKIVLLSTCNMGQTGPRADTPGFGSQLTALAGFSGLTGTAEGSPMVLYGPYIDFVASVMGAAAALAALDRSRREGRGAWVDISQYETGLHFVAAALYDYHRHGRIVERAGNRDPDAAPHGAYPCADNEWVALSCWSDDEFRRLAQSMGRPELAGDPRFADAAGRLRNGAALGAEIASWTRSNRAEALAARLQVAGVRAYRVNTMADIFADPQLVYRHIWRRRRHAEIGDQAYCFPAFDLSAHPGDITGAAPRLGADNEMVFRDLLGLSIDEYERFRRAGAFD